MKYYLTISLFIFLNFSILGQVEWPDKSQMEFIRKTLKGLNIDLPEEVEPYGEIKDSAGRIIYSLEKISNEEHVLHVSKSSRWSSPSYITISQNGKIQDLPAPLPSYGFDPKIPGDKEKQKKAHTSRNRKASANSIKIGIGGNLRIIINSNIPVFNNYTQQKSFQSENEIFHPNFKCKIESNCITFHSLTHFYLYWKSYYTKDKDLERRILNNPAISIDFLTEAEKTPTNDKWRDNRMRILLWGSILKFTQNEELKNELLKFTEHKFKFEDEHEYWGNSVNVLGGVMTRTCYDVHSLNWQEPVDTVTTTPQINTIKPKPLRRTYPTYFRPYVGVSYSKIVNNNGPNSSILVYDEKYDYRNLVYGIKISQQLSEKLLLGIDISQKNGGSITENNIIDLDYNLVSFSFRYIDFKIDTQIQLHSNIGFNLGLYQRLLLKAEWEEQLSSGQGEQIEKTDLYKKFDRGLSLGISGKYKKIVLAINYQHGLTKVIETDRLRWISLNLGYEFNIRKKK